MKYRVKIYDRNNNKEVKLLKELKKKKILDIDVNIGEKERVLVRLIAVQIPEKISSERRQKAKKNRDKRMNPSKEYLGLLGWEIFITNVSREIWNVEEVCKAYNIRWRIEIIFKAWKSHFEIEKVSEKTTKIAVEAYIYSMLIFIVIFQVHFFNYYLASVYKKTGKYLSLIKLARFVKENITMILLAIGNTEMLKQIEKQIYYHCKYESRKKRENYFQKFGILS